MQVDDTFDDVKAAFAEVANKTPETTAPAAKDTSTTSEVSDGDTSDVSSAKTDSGAGKKDVPRINGKFAPRKAVTAEKPGKEASQTAEHGEDGQQDEETAEASPPVKTSSAVSPPPSWSVKSKAAWDELPEHVRADIAKREVEVGHGLAALRDYKDLKPYAEMATKHGTTISAALKNYVAIENVLRKDLGMGFSMIAENYGLNQQQAAALFAGLAQKFGLTVQPGTVPNPAVNGGAQPQPGDPLYDILRPYIEPLKQTNEQLLQKLNSREQLDRNTAEQSLAKAIETFSIDPANRYFDELEETINRLFETGMVPLTGNHGSDLRTAYDTAAQMVPEVREALIEQRLKEQKAAERKKEQDAADRAKKASRSLTGSRIPGMTVKDGNQANGSHDDVEADVRAAWSLHAQH